MELGISKGTMNDKQQCKIKVSFTFLETGKYKDVIQGDIKIVKEGSLVTQEVKIPLQMQETLA